MIIHFMDGSIMNIDTGSNAGKIVEDFEFLQKKDLKAEDFQVSFALQWVHGLSRGCEDSNKNVDGKKAHLSS
jgi:hypothetical protein